MNKKVILFDLEGTLYTREGVITGAIETINNLKELNYEIRFLTNTDSLSQVSIYEKVKKLGFNVSLNEVYTPSRIINEHFSKEIKSAYFLTSKEIKEEFGQNGTIIESYFSDKCASHVVIGDVREVFNYESFNTAFRYLYKGAKLIALQEGTFYLSNNEKNIDTGSFVHMFEKVLTEEKILVGKPSPLFVSKIMEDLLLEDTNEFLIVGDDIFSDIKMGNEMNIDTVLVKTGKYKDQKNLSNCIKPKYLIESVAHLHKLLEDN